MSNSEWYQTSGMITMLVAPEQGDKTLRKPYQFALDSARAQELVKQLKDTTSHSELQCDLVDTKPTKYGFRLNIFLLGHSKGLCGGTKRVDKNQWDTIVQSMGNTLKQFLGEEIKEYKEDWAADKKFQYRFETYIKCT